ncbi:hypothetical protein GCM10027280_00070 [Micromonospora polyrhachis]
MRKVGVGDELAHVAHLLLDSPYRPGFPEWAGDLPEILRLDQLDRDHAMGRALGSLEIHRSVHICHVAATDGLQTAEPVRYLFGNH